MTLHTTIAVIGGGPAGLRATEVAAQAGVAVTLFDSKPSVGRKFLVAGKGGLNLTHGESIDRFAPDFSAFMKPNVDPAVQHAAMKKLFSDPHFNIMDRLDIYIDDYSIPDPIPMEMLKRMVQSESLGLFRKFEEGPGAKVLAESEEEKALEPEPTAAAEPDPAEIADASAGNVTMPQDEAKVDDVPNPDLDQTVASLKIVPEQKIK